MDKLCIWILGKMIKYLQVSVKVEGFEVPIYFKGISVGMGLALDIPKTAGNKDFSKPSRQFIVEILTRLGYEPSLEKNDLTLPTDEVKFDIYRRGSDTVLLSHYSVVLNTKKELIYRNESMTQTSVYLYITSTT